MILIYCDYRDEIRFDRNEIWTLGTYVSIISYIASIAIRHANLERKTTTTTM